MSGSIDLFLCPVGELNKVITQAPSTAPQTALASHPMCTAPQPLESLSVFQMTLASTFSTDLSINGILLSCSFILYQTGDPKEPIPSTA